ANGYPKFVDNTFVKQDNHASYRTIKSQYSSFPSTGDFIGNKFTNGASAESVDLEFWGPGKKEIKVGWHVDIQVKNASGAPLGGASVVVKTNTGAVIFNGSTNGNGSVRADVAQYLRTNVSGGVVVRKESRVSRTPHTIVVTKDGRTVTKTVTVAGNQTVQVVL
ncbi:MAG: carboxypeptidase-like regulatory domain-containing protein, partial [Nitrospirota bacterium]